MKLNLIKSFHKTIDAVIRYRVLIIWLAIFLLLGFTLWRMQAISNPQPDEAYLQSQREDPKNQITDIKLSEELKREIDLLRPTPVDVDPDDLGTQDPFNP